MFSGPVRWAGTRRGPVINDNRIRKVVIVGGGTAGWITAAVLARVAGSTLDIELVESAEIGTVGVGEATIPQIHLLLNVLGVDEFDFLSKVQGTYKLGIEFRGWTRPDHTYLHAFGPVGRDLGTLLFHHYWLRSVHSGGNPDLLAYSVTAAAARANRMATVARIEDTSLQGPTYAFHFDAMLVAKYLREYAEKRGVIRTEGKIVQTLLREPDGFIDAIVLDGGRKIAGELFIDCSGFRGLLIEEALHTGYENWSAWLPCDRALAVPCEGPHEPLTPYTAAIAHKAGWQWRIPLQHRVGNGYIYCSRYTSDEEARTTLLGNLDGKVLKDPWPLKFVTGHRRQFWNRNCVAIGLASGFLEPLESTSIHLAQTGVSHLLRYFPDKRFEPREIEEYNRKCQSEYEHVRDFIVMHYHVNGRPEPFWKMCREMEISAELTRKMELFRGTGCILRHEDDVFTEMSWLMVMIGQGIMPEAHHPLAHVITDAQLEEFLGNIRRIIDRNVPKMPTHREFVERHCRAVA